MRLPILLVALALAGCEGPAPGPVEIPSPVFDPQVVALALDRAVLRWDGSPQSLKLGSGWYDPETTAEGTSVWSSRRSQLYFAPPRADELDVLFSCSPLTYPGAPPQTVTPEINGTPLASIALQPGFQTVRFPLERRLLTSGINTLTFRFANAAKPSDVTGSRDQRSLAARFDRVAVTSRRLSDSEATATPNALDAARGRLSLRPGIGAGLPLPADPSIAVELGALSGDTRSRLVLDVLETDGSTRPVFDGPASQAAERVFRLRRDESQPAWLRLRLAEGSDGDSALAIDAATTRVRPDRATAPRPSDDRPHIFFYLIDTLRADALEPYGSELPTSPRIAELARDAVIFERAWSTSAWTYPATASVLTGSYPYRHGLTQLEEQPSPYPRTVGEWLTERGYDTLAISQSHIVGGAYGLDRGFQSFYLNDGLGKRGLYSGNVRWFLWHHLLARGASDRPLFCYLHTVDPHALYLPPEEDRQLADAHPGRLPQHFYNPNVFMRRKLGGETRETRHLHGLYLGEVRYADRQLGAFIDLLKYLGLYERSLIAVLSDHGEEFYEHGGFSHSRTLFEELLHVPLIVKFPDGWRAGTRVEARVTTLDLAATVLDLLGEDPTRLTPDGVSLRKIAEDEDAFRNRIVFAETRVKPQADRFPAGDLAALVAGDVKCIYSGNGLNQLYEEVPTFRAYDLAVDPGEKKPLPSTDPRANNCAEALRRRITLARTLSPTIEQTGTMTEEARARLRALGYLE